MTAAARQLEGALLEKTGAYTEAEAASLTAYMEAAKVRAWAVAASAAQNLVFTVGYRQALYAEGKSGRVTRSARSTSPSAGARS